jgi:hypothetical protein
MTDVVPSPDASGPETGAGSLAVEDEYGCPTCGVEILNESDRQEHLAGIDACRPECGRQDLEAIAERERLAAIWPRAIAGGTAW